MRYEQVVFMQGEDADEAFAIVDEIGDDVALEYLLQWYNPGEHEVREESSVGNDDTIELYPDPRSGDDGVLILSYNKRLGYIGLQRETRE